MAEPAKPTQPSEEASPMAELAGPTQLSEEAIKLIQDFTDWLSITNPTNWDKKSNGIYICNYLQLVKEI